MCDLYFFIFKKPWFLFHLVSELSQLVTLKLNMEIPICLILIKISYFYGDSLKIK